MTLPIIILILIHISPTKDRCKRYQNDFNLVLGGSYVHYFKPVYISDIVRFDRKKIRNECFGDITGALYYRWGKISSAFERIFKESMFYTPIPKIKRV